MIVDKDDLGLSLSLSCSKSTSNHDKTTSINRNRYPLRLNLMPCKLSSSSSSFTLPPSNLPCALAAPESNPWNESFGSADRTSEVLCKGIGDAAAGNPRSFLNGIDVKRLPEIAAEDEEAGVSSPNSTISSVSGKRSERETTGGGVDTERTCSRGVTDEEDGDTSRKKLRLSKDQSVVLEESFKENHTLNPIYSFQQQKLALAKRLGLRPRQVEVWFQNRRARTKLKQTEFDCEFMRKCCEQLTEENRRLQKEVQELRALKLSPQFYTHMTPPTTLTMCPSCERGAPSPSAHAQRRLPITPWGAPIGRLEAIHP